MTRMKEEHGFLATKAQYVRKLKDWAMEKNFTSEQWKHATDLVQQRKRSGKETDLLINGKVVSTKKLNKEFSRYGYLQNRVGIPTVARTPPSIQSVAVFLNTAPWLHFERLAEELLLPLRDSLMSRLGQALASGGQHHQIHSLRNILDNHKGKPTVPLRLEEKLSEWRGNENPKRLIQSEPLLHLLRCITYMSSNALTSDEATTNLLRWADQHGITWGIKGLIQGEGLTVELFSSKLLYASIKLNNINLARALLARGADPNRLSTDPDLASTNDQKTPLFSAVQKQQTELVKLLLNYGANPHMIVPAGDGISTALQFALEREGGEPQIAEMLIKAATEAAHAWSIPTHALLPAAAKGGEIALVELLLEAGVPLDERIWLDCALQAAARWNKLHIARLLRRWKVDVNCPGAYVHMGGRTEILRCLYDSGHMTPLQLYFSRHASDLTPLQFVTASGNVRMAKPLIQWGADVNGMMTWDVICPILKGDVDELLRQAKLFWNSNSKPALMHAAANGQLEMAELLLKSGADVSGRDIQTPLTVACESPKANRIEMVKLLLTWGANINAPAGRSYGGTALQNAVESKDVDLVNLLLDNGADVNAAAPVSTFRSAQGLAIFSDNMEMTKLLLDAGADPSNQDAVMAAVVKENSFEYVSLLLKYGASVSGHCFEHLPLVLVSRHGDYDTARLLADAGANVEVHGDDENAVTPLKVAVEKNVPEIVHLLLENGADVGRLRSMPKGFRNWLHLDNGKDRQREAEIIWDLIDHGIDINIGQSDETVLQAAIESQDLELLRLLLRQGADPNQSTGATAIQAAASMGNGQLVQDFLVRGADVNAPPGKDRGLTALQYAAIRGDLDMVVQLLEYGADVNAKAAARSWTALEGAAKYRRLDIVHILLENDGEAEFLERRCEKAAKLADEEGHCVIGRVLRKWKSV
ncbi:ankyrin repeat-containing domain protein [Ilyonectria sp. MPI-CAGE-AT-0026]|nr:ankyrin repeat-containing domain protein [Ilyonectria sp. MPI-CAGE-AT-0026]